MHQLTIAAQTGATTTTHHDYDAASQALLAHAKRSDTYLRIVAPAKPSSTAQRACFELISLDDPRGCPSVTAAAFIEPLVVTPAGRPVTPYYAAAAALDWISDHRAAATAAAEPHEHPALDAAHAALQSTLLAGSLWREAADLAELPDVAVLPACVLADLRYMVVSRGFRPASAAALAAVVQRQLDTSASSEQVAVATWWTALVSESAAVR